MTTLRRVLVVSLMVLSIASEAAAADFEWLKNLNIQAQADPSGFKACLAARFKIGDAQKAIVGSDAWTLKVHD